MKDWKRITDAGCPLTVLLLTTENAPSTRGNNGRKEKKRGREGEEERIGLTWNTLLKGHNAFVP